MRKIQKFLMLLLFVCLSVSIIPATKSNAEETQGEQASASSELKDENPYRLEEVTGMTENGDIVPVEEVEGETEETPKMATLSRDSSVKVVNFRTKGNAVTNYTEVGTGVAGYTNGAFGGDAAYLGTSNGKVKFMLSGVVGEVSASEVEVLNKSDVAVVSCYVVNGGRLIHNVAYNIKTPGWAAKMDNGAAPSYLKAGVEYYSYDGHYFYTDYATMLADYQKNSRSNSVNPSNPYYNYYQYLPLRSQTSYSAAQINAMISSKTSGNSKMYNTGADFVNNQNTYGVNALLMTGVAGTESAWGTSKISQEKNNLFGLNAVDTSPGTSANTYASPQECIRQFADGWMSRGYLYPADSRYRGGFLGNKGSGLNVKYASDPYWGEKIANVVYSLDKQGGSKDYNKYTIGVKDTIATSHTAVNVRNGSNTSATKLYSSGKSSNYAVLIQNKTPENGFYRIQSDAVLNGNRTAIVKDQGKYSYDNMYAYISADYVKPVNQGNVTEEVLPPTEPTPPTEEPGDNNGENNVTPPVTPEPPAEEPNGNEPGAGTEPPETEVPPSEEPNGNESGTDTTPPTTEEPPADEPSDDNSASDGATNITPPVQVPPSSNAVTTPPVNTTTTPPAATTPSSTDTKKDDKTPTEQTKNKSVDDKAVNGGNTVKVAKTGDASSMGIWFVLCAMAAMGIVVVMMQKRKVN